jgi:hypothetical protein
MERIRPSEGHSRPGERRRMDKSGQGKNPTDIARGTHPLASTDGRTSQDRERIQPSEGHSRPGERRRTDKIRTEKESDTARGTYFLECADGRTSQDTERIQPSEGHSLPRERTRTDKSGHRNNPTQRGALTSWGAQT